VKKGSGLLQIFKSKKANGFGCYHKATYLCVRFLKPDSGSQRQPTGFENLCEPQITKKIWYELQDVFIFAVRLQKNQQFFSRC
jgi:hypothetical protein